MRRRCTRFSRNTSKHQVQSPEDGRKMAGRPAIKCLYLLDDCVTKRPEQAPVIIIYQDPAKPKRRLERRQSCKDKLERMKSRSED